MFFRSSKTGGQSSTSKAPSMEGANANQNTNNTAASNSENVTMQSPPILPPRRRSSMLPSQHREGDSGGNRPPSPVAKDNKSISSLDPNQTNRIIQKYPSLSLMSSSAGSNGTALYSQSNPASRDTVASTASTSSIPQASSSAIFAPTASSSSSSNNLVRINASKLRKNTISPDAISKQAPMLNSATNTGTQQNGQSNPSILNPGQLHQQRRESQTSAQGQQRRESQASAHGQQRRDSQTSAQGQDQQQRRESQASVKGQDQQQRRDSQASVQGQHQQQRKVSNSQVNPQEASPGAPLPVYVNGVFVGYNSGMAGASARPGPAVVRPVANRDFNPSAPAPQTVQYQARPMPVVVQTTPPNLNSMYQNQYQLQQQQQQQIMIQQQQFAPRPAWVPARGRPPHAIPGESDGGPMMYRPPSNGGPIMYRPASNGGPIMYRPPPPNFRPQHPYPPQQQFQQHPQQQGEGRPYMIPRPFDPPPPNQQSSQQQHPVQPPNQDVNQPKQVYKVPRPFDPQPAPSPPQSILPQPQSVGPFQGQMYSNQMQQSRPPMQHQGGFVRPAPVPNQMGHPQQQPGSGGFFRPVPGPAKRPPMLQQHLYQQPDQQLQRPPSPKRKASFSMDPEATTGKSSTSKSEVSGNVSPSKELRMDQLAMSSPSASVPIKAAHASLNSESPAYLFRENSINVLASSPASGAGTPSTNGPTRRSYENDKTDATVLKAGLDRRNSMDEGSLSRKKDIDGGRADDEGSEYTESDAGSSRASSVYTSHSQASYASGVVPDVMPSFVTLARQRNESLVSQHLSQQNLVRIMEELRGEARNSKDPKVLFEFAKACLAAGEPHIDEGFSLLKKVASNGYPEAHFFLGEAYADDGKYSLAYSQFLSAAKRGFAPACHAIGKCAESGKGCKKNMRLALEMYTKAATAGSLESMYRLGCAEMKGELRLKKDPVKATKWFKRAAAVPNRKHPEPLFELANIYETGLPPYILQDFAYARGVLQEAVDFGYPQAIYKLGYSLEHGLLGYDVNPPESMRLYTLAMNLGHVEAYLGMAGWHMTGVENYLPQDQEMAFQLVKEAADRGLARAQYTLGYFYEGGIGVASDTEKAFSYYTLAADQGEERAQNRLEKANRPRRSNRGNDKKKKNSFFGGLFK